MKIVVVLGILLLLITMYKSPLTDEKQNNIVKQCTTGIFESYNPAFQEYCIKSHKEKYKRGEDSFATLTVDELFARHEKSNSSKKILSKSLRKEQEDSIAELCSLTDSYVLAAFIFYTKNKNMSSKERTVYFKEMAKNVKKTGSLVELMDFSFLRLSIELFYEEDNKVESIKFRVHQRCKNLYSPILGY